MMPTAEQTAEFEQYLVEWQERLNLLDWRIELYSGKAPGAMADVTMHSDARLAQVRLGDWRSVPITSPALRSTAAHECLHVLLYDLIEAARSRDRDAVEVQEHRLIHLLEKLLSS